MPTADPRTMLGMESRASDSPYVQRVWRSVARGGPMSSLAFSHRMLVFWWRDGELWFTVRGPATAPSQHDVPPGFASLGIVLSHGVALPRWPSRALVDRSVDTPGTGGWRVSVGGEELPVPSYDAAEDVVDRLVRSGWLVRDRLVDDVLAGGSTTVSRRTVQRRVLAATGLTPGAITRIERARQAAVLLGEDRTPADVVGRLGFYDHAHLAHALGRFVGLTPSELRTPRTALSLLYKLDELPAA